MTDTKGVAPTPTASPTELATNPLSSILSNAYDPYGDILKELTKPKQLTTDQMAAQALLTLLPIAIGAATRGGSGAAIGAQSGVTGLGYLLGKQDEQEKRELAVKMQEAQTGSILSRSMLSSGMAMARQAEAERLKLANKITFEKWKEDNGIGENEVIDAKNAERLATKLDLPADALEGKSVKQARLMISGEQAAISRLNAQTVSEDAKRRRLMVKQRAAEVIIPGYSIQTGLSPDAIGDAKIMKQKESARQVINGLAVKLREELDARGVKFLGKDSKTREALDSALMWAFKELEGAGANFTEKEMGFVAGQKPDTDTFLNFLISKGKGRDTSYSVAKMVEIVNDRIFNEALGHGYYRVGYQYNPETLKQAKKRMTFDSEGLPAYNPWYEQKFILPLDPEWEIGGVSQGKPMMSEEEFIANYIKAAQQQRAIK